jgi:hypothetical protein
MTLNFYISYCVKQEKFKNMSFLFIFLLIGAATGETGPEPVDLKHVCVESIGILTCDDVGVHNFIYSTPNQQITRVQFNGQMGGQVDVHNLPNVDTVVTESNICCADIVGHAVELFNTSGRFLCSVKYL